MTFKGAWLMKLKHFSPEAAEKVKYPFARPPHEMAQVREQAGNNANGFAPLPSSMGRR